jgi:hypothetical protein
LARSPPPCSFYLVSKPQNTKIHPHDYLMIEIIIHSGQPEPCVSFKSKWTDQKPQTGEMGWYMKALEFYNYAPKPD